MKRRNRTVDPKTLRKRSKIVQKQEKVFENSFLVKGERKQTKTGFIVSGYKGEIETYYEVMLAKTSTNVLSHPKKTRIYRIIGGGGSFMVKGGESKKVVNRVASGDEIVVPPGSEYRILAADFGLKFLVSQEKKYNARLEVVENTEISTEVPFELLKEPKEEDINQITTAAQGIKPRRGSKAVQQQLNKGSNGGGSKEPPTYERVPEAGAAGINAKPTMGRFVE